MASSNVKKASPAWKNPRDIFKRHLKRKSSSRRLITEAVSSPALLQTEIVTESQPEFGSTASRRSTRLANPFKRGSPRKRALRQCSADGQENDIPSASWDSQDAQHAFCSLSVFKQIDEVEESSFKRVKASFCDEHISEIYPIDFSGLASGCSSTPKSSKLIKLDELEKTKSKVLPTDVRLGTKLRMESNKPFPWMDRPNVPGVYKINVSGLEQDLAVRMFNSDSSNIGFAKCDAESRSNGFSSPSDTLSGAVRLQTATMYWQYPDLPWLRMFPRLDGSHKMAGGSIKDSQTSTLQALGPAFVTSVAQQWIQAFEQLFHSWKKGARPNFYLCCSSFTALFLKTPREAVGEIDDDSTCSSWRVGGDFCFRVLITPTTIGFRELLRNEGISFIMVSKQSVSRRSSKEHGHALDNELNENTDTSDHSASQPVFMLSEKGADLPNAVDFSGVRAESDEDGSPNKMNGSCDSDNMTWLKDIGMSPASTKRLTRHLSMISMGNRSGESVESGKSSLLSASADDETSKSTIIISEPGSIQALFNLINTSKVCRPVTGPNAGLPPTLLSAQPFLHSALCNLNKCSQVVKRGKNEMVYVCELDNGPIMPHMIPSVMDFVRNCASDNTVTVYVSGRPACQGFNQAIASPNFVDTNQFSYTMQDAFFSY